MELSDEDVNRINRTMRDLQLKNQALTEALSKAAGEHANEVSDLRVEVTNLKDEIEALRNQAQQPPEQVQVTDEVVHEITDLPKPPSA